MCVCVCVCLQCVYMVNQCTRPLLRCTHSGVWFGGRGPGCRQEVVQGRGRRDVWRAARRCRRAAEGRRGLKNRTRTNRTNRTSCRNNQTLNVFISFCVLTVGGRSHGGEPAPGGSRTRRSSRRRRSLLLLLQEIQRPLQVTHSEAAGQEHLLPTPRKLLQLLLQGDVS